MGPKIQILAQKSIFCYRTPDFVNDPFVDLGKTVDLAPSDWFFDFLFVRNGPFCKKTGWCAKKSSPTPLWGHRLQVTALALSARRPFGPARFARGPDKTVYCCDTLNYGIFCQKLLKDALRAEKMVESALRAYSTLYPTMIFFNWVVSLFAENFFMG